MPDQLQRKLLQNICVRNPLNIHHNSSLFYPLICQWKRRWVSNFLLHQKMLIFNGLTRHSLSSVFLKFKYIIIDIKYLGSSYSRTNASTDIFHLKFFLSPIFLYQHCDKTQLYLSLSNFKLKQQLIGDLVCFCVK